MPHNITLITTIVAALGGALALGFLAARLKLPVLIGYLAAGIVLGPFTPGFVADVDLSMQLAEIGVMLLMFGVGLHFSIDELLAVRKIAIPGAIVQIAVAALLGIAVTNLWGWNLAAGLVFGLALSVASTVVLLRALESRGMLETVNGRIAVGWLGRAQNNGNLFGEQRFLRRQLFHRRHRAVRLYPCRRRRRFPAG